ncbi:MAG: four helix bundle protein [Bacteroidetes bacterium]|nr:four helix bundle protein [Bacteroidota bacterium]
MATIQSFEEIESWKTARELCRRIGVLIDDGRFKNSYRLISQIDAASGSVMDNIADGFERGSRAEFINFLGYAKGSCGELRSQLYRLLDRTYINQSEFDELFEMTSKTIAMIQKFIAYLIKTEIAGSRRKQTKNLNVKP